MTMYYPNKCLIIYEIVKCKQKSYCIFRVKVIFEICSMEYS